MLRTLICVISVFLILGANGCGGTASAGSNGSGSGGGTPSDAPTLTAIAPSATVVGAPALAILAYGSNFKDGATINWNGTALTTSCVNAILGQVPCSNAAALAATVPAADFAATGTAKVVLTNPPGTGTSGGTSSPLSFTIGQASSGNIWVRAVPDISAPNDIVWDALHSKLYVSVSSTNPTNANTIAVIDPVAGNVTSYAPAGNDPNLLSISSDGGYLWAGLDGSHSVQRFLLPSLSPDISFSLPKDSAGNPQQAVALEAAPMSAHTMALIAGYSGGSPAGDGVYVYDDATVRSNFVPGPGVGGGPMIDWMQWGSDDTTIYGNQYTTVDAGGIATLNVDSSGVTLGSYKGGLFLQPTITQYDSSNRLLYSYSGAYDPTQPSLMGSFDLPQLPTEACTADSSLNRYYCVIAFIVAGSDIAEFDLSVFDLSSYSLLDQVYFGTSSGIFLSPMSGRPLRLVRWGNAGLALLTYTGAYYGSGGVFLIDGAAVNPNTAPDTTAGTASESYAWLSSMSPDSATSASGDVEVTIQGRGFSPDSTACWNCNSLQFRFLPTTYVSPTELNVTIPLSSVMSTEPLEISVFDQGTNLFSSNALTFTVMPSSSTMQVIPVNLCGLAMAWDASSQLLYVSTADYDSAYPNSIVAVDPTTGLVVKQQTVESDPLFLSESASDEFLYAAYASATNLTQLSLPGMNPTVTAPLVGANGDTWVPGDMKAAPQDPHTVAATLIMPGFSPEALGGVAVYDDGTPRLNSMPGWTGGQTVAADYDTLAWSGSDQLLTAAPSYWDNGLTGPLYQLQVDSSGLSYLGQGPVTIDTNGGYLHSDFGTGLIYSDGGEVIDPNSGTIVGNFGSSGLVVPDSSLNRVFILGQTASQVGTTTYTIDSFDQTTFNLVSSITLSNFSGIPIALARWGTTGLAVLTMGGLGSGEVDGLGMLYMIQDAAFVSNNPASTSVQKVKMERVQRRWKVMTIRERLKLEHKIIRSRWTCCNTGRMPTP